MKRYVLGDIHGALKALKQVFERSNFDYEHDQLIFLGDVSDGWPETKECIDELLKIKHLIALKGNHDEWTQLWMQTGWCEDIWLSQGGRATVDSYDHTPIQNHIDYFNNTQLYHITKDNKCFVHGGFKTFEPIESQSKDILLWDRTLISAAINNSLTQNNNAPLTHYNEVFIGHTATLRFSKIPIKLCDVWCMDQGAGWSGKLSLMDIDSKEYWQSDNVQSLYPNIKGR